MEGVIRLSIEQPWFRKLKDCCRHGWKLVTERQADPWEKALLVCGCPVACANRAEVRGLARQWVLISGPMVDREMVPEDQMATVIVRKIKTIDPLSNVDIWLK